MNPLTEHPWIYMEDAIPADLGKRAFDQCVKQTIDLVPRQTKLFGRAGKEPRLSQLYSTQLGHEFKYSGVVQKARLFEDIPEIQELMDVIQQHLIQLKLPMQTFDTALVNHYRANTRDRVGAHRDKDGVDAIIASISLGRPAPFVIHKVDRVEGNSIAEAMTLQPNSLLLMLPGMQSEYLHEIKAYTKKQIKADPRLADARINITLRKQLV